MKFLKKILFITIATSIGMSSMALAHGWGRGHGGWQKGDNQQADSRPGQVLREEMYQARIDVLTELTEQTEETIKAKLEYKPLWAVLDEFKADFKVFQSKMHEKADLIVKKAVEEGKITQEQADFMTKRMRDGKKRGFRGKGRGHRGFGGNCPMN